jgi:hypothetical protein
MINSYWKIALFVVGVLLVVHIIRSAVNEAKLNKIEDGIIPNLNGKPAFLCSGINLLGTNKDNINLYLLGGDFVNINAKAGMSVNIMGQEYEITDVSNEDGNQVDTIGALSNKQIGYIGITTNKLDLDGLKDKIKREKVLTLFITQK